MNQPDAYYVRLARAVEGPLSRQELLHRLELNLYSTYHEVSADQQQWKPLHRSMLNELQAKTPPPTDGPVSQAPQEQGVDGGGDSLAWLEDLGRSADEPNGQAGTAAYRSASGPGTAASWFCATAMSAGMLLVVVASLPIPRRDGGGGGGRGGWWDFSEPLGWTLGVWGLVGLSGVVVAWVPERFPRGRILLAAAALGWVGGLVLLGGSAALGSVAAAWGAVLPILAWCLASSIVGRFDPRRAQDVYAGSPPAWAVWLMVGGAWLSGVLFTLRGEGLPVWWIMVVTAALSPAGIIALRCRGGGTAGSPLPFLWPGVGLAAGLFLSSVVLGVHQNLQQDASHVLGQLVTAAVGMIAVGGCAVAAGLDLWSDAY